MGEKTRCAECGALWNTERTCQDIFHLMLFWENENPEYARVHHLMVLCYYIQHPSLYSPEGLTEAIQLLRDFVGSATPARVRRHNAVRMNSGQRDWKIKGTKGQRASHADSICWTMTGLDVIEAGKRNYCDSVQRWAASILKSLDLPANILG